MFETVSIISLVLAAVSAVISVSLMGRVKKVERALEVPVAKKLSPDSKLKHHKKGNLYNSGAKIEEIGGEGEGNRGKNNGRNAKQNAQKQTAPQAGEKPQGSEPKAEGREGREGREKNGRRNRRDGRRRFEASSEIVSNEASAEYSEKPAVPATEAPAAPVAAPAIPTPAPVAAPKQAAPEAAITRPALAPRGQRADESAPVAPAPVQSAPAAEEFAAPAIDPSTIRHGRRNTVRRNPALDDSEE